jgi:hypothetical protein
MKRLALILVALLLAAPAWGQGMTPGISLEALGYCQLSASQLAAAISITQCVRASWTGNANPSGSTQLVATAVTGKILIGDVVVGTGVPSGVTIVSQLSGTPNGQGAYILSAPTTASAASITSGGVPLTATVAYFSVEAASSGIRWRDDGVAPTASVGQLMLTGAAPVLYTGSIPALQFIANTGSPLVDITFFKSP